MRGTVQEGLVLVIVVTGIEDADTLETLGIGLIGTGEDQGKDVEDTLSRGRDHQLVETEIEETVVAAIRTTTTGEEIAETGTEVDAIGPTLETL